MTETVAGLTAQELRDVADDARLRELAEAPVFTVFQRVATSPRGLTEPEAADRLRRFGDNEPFRAADDGVAARVAGAVRSPFVALLAGLAVVFVVVGDTRGAVTVAVMVTLAVVLRIWQQTRSVRANRALQELVASTVTVRRRAGHDQDPLEREVLLHDVVPGDIVVLHAGDVVPADLRIVSSTDLVVDQSGLSGESLPVAKTTVAPAKRQHARQSLVDTPSLAFSGTAVVAGAATAVVIATGGHTYFGALARTAGGLRPESSFDRGVRSVGWTLVRFMLVMVPIVLAVNGIVSGNWAQAAMFAVAVAVGLTPEMLPVIVTTNLARGATRLARERVIVSRLNAIQDLGALDVLCVDKTGTLTEDRIVYAHTIDVTGRFDDAVAELAYLGVHFQDGAHDRLDDAIAELLGEQDMALTAEAAFEKVDEIGFDHTRRRATVVVARQHGEHIMICKGDPDRVLPRCTRSRLDDDIVTFGDDLRAEADDLVEAYRKQGMRVLAVAVKYGPARFECYDESDEQNLVLAGFVGFVDPVRDSAPDAVRSLAEHGVAVKILTGDSKTVARQVAAQVGVAADTVVVGHQIDRLSDRRLSAASAQAAVFAELTPAHKTRIVAALREDGHVVGFLGDGINDVPALRIADAGIAADTAAEVAKYAADLILLDKDLAVVASGVVEGRRTLANTMKYVKISASSNFGNVLSVLAASALLPFLPILPIQLMVQNLLYDTAQLALSWDRVDNDYLRAPRRWQSGGLIRFMLIFGPLSSMFDLATFAVLWWVFDLGDKPTMFQTGWFVEGLLTQLLVVLVLRAPTKPWRGARPTRVVALATLTAAAIGVLLPLTPLGVGLGMAPPPAAYLVWLVAVLATYGLAAHLVKKHYLRHYQAWL
ncbi:magnesium-translocating P-type ATPase [Mycolicibacterium moriokaense]|uniref:Magnesium-transporting ATPase, P-type 1 n=1 Tax=Mycolicibacterium moriokaense TaxID=39691 RepID=A0A318HDB7_9MYCO|nr:magnesium-translocating P-type ATPase [Mycolicibacterium moriokaense]PXX06629.1 Mg2+-importing ATPase [Mycolicibacterium moriokaense]